MANSTLCLLTSCLSPENTLLYVVVFPLIQIPKHTVPTGISSVPPLGPASPVIPTPIFAPHSLAIPVAISCATFSLTTSKVSIVSCFTSVYFILASFEYVTILEFITFEAFATLTIVLANNPAVQLSADDIVYPFSILLVLLAFFASEVEIAAFAVDGLLENKRNVRM